MKTTEQINNIGKLVKDKFNTENYDIILKWGNYNKTWRCSVSAYNTTWDRLFVHHTTGIFAKESLDEMIKEIRKHGK